MQAPAIKGGCKKLSILKPPTASLRLMSTSAVPSSYRPSESQTFSLPDGRTLGYAEYGHPRGYPVLFFHGYPSCRLEGYPIDRLAHHRQLRIISLERPGFGLSTFQPNRTILDWPKDVEAFVRGKEISRFAVLGASGGGPYAVACAKTIPAHMMSAVGVFAGGPPWEAGPQHMAWYRRFARWLVNFSPTLFTALFGGIIKFASWLAHTGPIVRRIDKFLETSDKKKKERETPSPTADLGMIGDEGFTIAQRRDRLLRLIMREPYAGGLAGFVRETKLLSDIDWGFKLESVNYGHIKIWHGVRDSNAPIQTIRWMAERLPNATLTEFDKTHYDIADHFGTALSDLVSEEEIKKYTEAV
ncbi:hypothetical protein H072_6475 [Dactylellina haptotyla CBS 200.50]|uniref:AB hydrolase-1 domain-containing protein n=1 Tax=Dactylellina haptotyla (strain CBS 200.50) TaxID=1284197 RepID=S8AA07_DACHA|nr:hypothetical protein H072_6475 [Dactylellina haptotyla CBS 200.50]